MTSDLHHKRRQIHRRVVLRVAEMVATLTSFVVIFSILLTLSNWSAYSRILQDVIDPEAMAGYMQVEDLLRQEQQEEEALRKRLEQETNPDFAEGSSLDGEVFDLTDMGQLYPDEMRLEVPKVFSGTIPVKNVEIENFDFKDLYESENKIQEALQQGVVHYPFTADPDEYGNVFITGHSSYQPWDPGKYKDIFALLHKLEEGDQYFVTYKGKRYTYTVREIFEIQPDDVSVLEQPLDEKISTLMTCTPVGTTLRRLIVRAELTDVSP